MTNLELYRIFYEVAINKNITKASSVLNISQPAVTKHIKNLEDSLGEVLFIRTKRGVVLTEVGNKLFLKVKQALSIIDDVELSIKENKNLHNTTIRVGISTTLAKIYLMDYIDNKIKEAYDFATKVHYNQKRRDNTPYISHPIRVAENVRKYINSNNKDNLIICAYLHDTLEDGDITYNDIVDRFGIKIANIVLELTNDNVIKNELGKTRYLQLKMNNMSNDALCVKLCDRLDNIKDLVNADKTFQYKYLIETKSIIDYILNNRKLTDTHLVIIKEIKSEMAKYKISYKAKVKRLSNA